MSVAVLTTLLMYKYTRQGKRQHNYCIIISLFKSKNYVQLLIKEWKKCLCESISYLVFPYMTVFSIIINEIVDNRFLMLTLIFVNY